MSLHLLSGKSFFWQWDTGQKCVVDCLNCQEVHFSNDAMDHALVVPICTQIDGSRTVQIPNILLQSASPVKAYVYLESGSTGTTLAKYIFPVFARPKPQDYVYTETEVLSYSALDAKIQKLDNEKIGNLEELSTDAKGSLVAAVNEVNGRVPSAAQAQEGSFLRVVDGAWAAVTVPNGEEACF